MVIVIDRQSRQVRVLFSPDTNRNTIVERSQFECIINVALGPSHPICDEIRCQLVDLFNEANFETEFRFLKGYRSHRDR